MALIRERARLVRRMSSALLMVLAPSPVHAQVSWQREFDRARQLADDGSLREAQRIFDTGVGKLPASSPLLAYAYFGRAFVARSSA